MRISAVRHPEYTDDSYDMFKWRLAYKGGRHFIDRYLKRYSKREDRVAFKERREITYSPSFAKALIDRVKNTFYSRMPQIQRLGGSPTYQAAVRGKEGGVDLHGSSMNTFIGHEVIKELMVMKKVGVYVDMPGYDGDLLVNNYGKRPYLYLYKAEDILAWNTSYIQGEFVFTNVFLRDTYYSYDKETGLQDGLRDRFRHIWLDQIVLPDGNIKPIVKIQFWVTRTDNNVEFDVKDGEEITLDMPRLPFVVGELHESLMADLADYQIALMNLSSSDINYVFKANFPLYTEQFDPRSDSPHLRRPGPPTVNPNPGIKAAPQSNIDPLTGNDPLLGSGLLASTGNEADQTKIGSLDGRKYAMGLDRPDYVYPSPEPLMASMKKQDQMKEEMAQLIDAALTQAKPQHASAESKSMDSTGVESGLSAIGLELEYMEREVAKIWALYEHSDTATINYPEKYTLKSDTDRLNEAKALDSVKSSTPSRIYGKEIAKQIGITMLSGKVSHERLDDILQEIEDSDWISSDPNLIQIASELGMVDAVTGSNALGFDGKKVVPLAQKEHADRLAQIAASQATGAARGVSDKGPIQGKDQQGKDLNKGDPPTMGGAQ